MDIKPSGTPDSTNAMSFELCEEVVVSPPYILPSSIDVGPPQQREACLPVPNRDGSVWNGSAGEKNQGNGGDDADDDFDAAIIPNMTQLHPQPQKPPMAPHQGLGAGIHGLSDSASPWSKFRAEPPAEFTGNDLCPQLAVPACVAHTKPVPRDATTPVALPFFMNRVGQQREMSMSHASDVTSAAGDPEIGFAAESCSTAACFSTSCTPSWALVSPPSFNGGANNPSSVSPVGFAASSSITSSGDIPCPTIVPYNSLELLEHTSP